MSPIQLSGVSLISKFFCRDIRDRISDKLKIKNHVVREVLAEMFGTFIFVSFGCGSIAQYIFQGRLDFFSVNIAFGFGLSLGILVSNHVSGKWSTRLWSRDLSLKVLTFGKFFVSKVVTSIQLSA